MKRILYLTLLLFCVVQMLHAQSNITVSGKVTSETGDPMPGLTITVKGTTNGAATNIDGSFSLPVPNANSVLVFSFIGYETQEVPVNNRTTVNVTMQPDAKALEEVVVTGYQSERKKDLTGAVSVVDTDEMKKQSVANPIKALQGQVAGMFVTGNGSPSSPATVRIRGIGTLNNNDPLYIVDGVPTKAGMHELNPADIESLQVLKDASAASIYGSRAANGVIIITTKRGKAGVAQISANAYTSISRYTDRTEMLDTEGYGRAFGKPILTTVATPTPIVFNIDLTGTLILQRELLF